MQDNVTILVSGAPGTGKSTIQRLAPDYFRSCLGEAAAIGTDEIYTIIDPYWTMVHEQWGQIARNNCIVLTKSLFEQGINIVLICGNALYPKPIVNDYIAALSSISSVYHFTLDASAEVVVERVRQRGDLVMHPPEWLAGWLDYIRCYYDNWTYVIDTSLISPEETLRIIYQKIIQREGALTELLV